MDILDKLHKDFQIHIPIKDNVWWNGVPYLHENCNLKRWHPKWTQGFGMNPQIYAQFNMKGHNGLDIGFSEGTPIVAPCDIEVQAIQYSDKGYGINLRAFTKEVDEHKLEFIFGHFREIVAKPYREYKEGDLLGYGDSTGFSTGHHLHFGIRPLYKKGAGWRQLYYGNGYYGYVDPEPFIIEKVRWTIGELNNLKKMKFYKEEMNPAIYFKGADNKYYPVNSETSFKRLFGEFKDNEIIESEPDSLQPKGERLGLII